MAPKVVALFGLGRAGMIHSRNIMINPNLRLKYIVEILVEKAQKLVKDYDLNTTVLSPSEADKVYTDPE